MSLFLSPFLILVVVAVVLLGVGVARSQEAGSGRIEGSGVSAVQQRDLPPFTGVEIGLPANVRIACGTPQRVGVTADDNLLPHIVMRVEHGVLVISSAHPFTTRRPVTIELDVADLDLVRLVGTGDVEVTGAASRELRLSIVGSGTIHAVGTAATMRGEVSGAGTIDGSRLTVETAIATVSGVGTIATAPTARLDANISGSGIISYEGEPLVRSRISGVGAVRGVGERR